MSDTVNNTLSPTASAFAITEIRVNDLFKPFTTVAGGNVTSNWMAGLSEWSSMYERYRVLGCKISTKFINQTALPFHIYLGMNPANQLAPLSPSVAVNSVPWQEAKQTIMTNPKYYKYTTLGEVSGGKDCITMTKYMSMRNLFSGGSVSSGEFMGQTSFSGLISGTPNYPATSPTNPMFGYIGLLNTVPAVCTGVVTTQTKYTFYTQFSQKDTELN